MNVTQVAVTAKKQLVGPDHYVVPDEGTIKTGLSDVLINVPKWRENSADEEMSI